MVAAQTLLDEERPLTYDDLGSMPDDGRRYEIIGGELIVNPAPTSGHQRVFLTLARILDDYAFETGAGELHPAPFDVVFSPHDALQPDLVFLLSSHPRVKDEENSIDYPPDLLVEVVSPSSTGIDRVRKMGLYAKFGVPEYWIADPWQKTLTLYTLEGGSYTPIIPGTDGVVESLVLPGLRVDSALVFARLQ